MTKYSRIFKFFISIFISIFISVSIVSSAYAGDVAMPDEKLTLGKSIPNAKLFDSKGHEFFIKDITAGKPLVISFIYTRCLTACLVITDALNEVVTKAGGLGKDFKVLTLSFDPMDMVHDLDKFKRQWRLNEESWIVAAGEKEEVKKILDAVQFRYVYDMASREFLHPNFIVILTPNGKISRYLYGVSPREKDFKLGIIEAKKGGTSFSVLDGFLLRCFRFDDATKSYKVDYGFLIHLVMGSITILTIFLVVWGKDIYCFIFRKKKPAY
ncbi:MAG: SCO family protein [Nitrospirae bacterium]|nr:SCO family protein [Nitrospirota bacterium]